jgi:hypothetical protein
VPRSFRELKQAGDEPEVRKEVVTSVLQRAVVPRAQRESKQAEPEIAPDVVHSVLIRAAVPASRRQPAPGTLEHSLEDGSIYIGELNKAGQRHGRGECQFPNNCVYIGDWDADHFHGQGTYKDSAGYEYVGGFKEGLCHGKGCIKYPKGGEYNGDWELDN